jgi:hypothetical protein
VEFGWSLVDGTVPGMLGAGARRPVFVLRPGTPESRLFLAFCLVTATISLTYNDLVTTHRFTRLLLALWRSRPALMLHLALTFPERRSVDDRWPWVDPPAVCRPRRARRMAPAQLSCASPAPVGEIVAGYAGSPRSR